MKKFRITEAELYNIICEVVEEATSEDSEYLDAVRSGDMAKAERMVKEAAKRAMPDTKVIGEDGMPIAVYHGSDSAAFSIFKPKEAGVIFLTTNDVVAGTYSESHRIREVGNAFTDESRGTYLNNIVAKAAGILKDKYDMDISTNDLKVAFEEGFKKSTYKSEYKLPLLSLLHGYYKRPSISDYPDFNEFLEKWNEYKKVSERVGDAITEVERMFVDAYAKFNGGTYAVYANTKNPLIVDAKSNGYKSIEFRGQNTTASNIATIAKKEGYDGVIIKNVHDEGLYGYGSPIADDVIVFLPNQIKSADIVTYDDNGEIIPLSERFDMSINDVRY